MQFTVEQVLGLAPDDASAKAAKGLVVPSKWPTLGASDDALWGECLGSGAKPYQVQMDFSGPAFRCTCPSRKFPCKHGLALLLLNVQSRDAFHSTSPPEWVSEWLASRRTSAAKKEQRKDADSAPSDPNAAAKRDAKRLERIEAGARDLRRWLADQVSQGLANLAGAHAEFDRLAARMVDAQAPGLAFRVRRMRDTLAAGGQWHARLLAQMGRLQLLLDALERVDTLPTAVQADVRSAVGWPTDKDDALASGDRVDDAWFVLGQSNIESAKLWERRVWLHGLESGRRSMLLDFAHGSRNFEHGFLTGTSVRMALGFFASASPLRASIVEGPGSVDRSGAAPPVASIDDALAWIADSVSANPWQSPLPLACNDGVAATDAAGWSLRTNGQGRLPLALGDDDGWRIVALGGGAPITLFGEWNGERLHPLSCWSHELVWTRADA